MDKAFIASLLTLTFLVGCNENKEPEPVVDIHAVTESEFNDALSFKNVQYLQKNDSIIGIPAQKEEVEMSPTVYHKIFTTSPIPLVTEGTYEEEYISKNSDGTYDKYYRDSKSIGYALTKGVSEENFKTPQSENILKKITEMGGSYSDFRYVGNKYTAEFADESAMTLEFENKKVITLHNSPRDATYKYEEITPDLPDPSNL